MQCSPNAAWRSPCSLAFLLRRYVAYMVDSSRRAGEKENHPALVSEVEMELGECETVATSLTPHGAAGNPRPRALTRVTCSAKAGAE